MRKYFIFIIVIFGELKNPSFSQTIYQIGNSNTQINNVTIKSDSTKLTKAIIKLLYKNGYKNVTFDLRIVEKGSKNTYITNNNYYSDSSNFLAGRNNIEWKFDSFRNHYGVYVWPKKGKWDMPYVSVPRFYLKENQDPILENYNGATKIIHYRGQRLECADASPMRICNSNVPIFIPIEYQYSYIFFGDASDSSKNYVYDMGDIEHRPSVQSQKY